MGRAACVRSAWQKKNSKNTRRSATSERRPNQKAGRAKGSGRRFVIQKHAASRLHYDLRLELDGVLKSWAVPKGPALDPKERRLAIHVEDHPLEYGSFEGTIPKNQYGGGTVMLWDKGEWEPADGSEAGKAYKKGKLKFRLHGEKLHGVWNLVRMGGKASEDGDNWLLIKEKDDEARPIKKYDILDEEPVSVSTGRDMDEIAAANGSNGNRRKATKKSTAAKSSSKRVDPASLGLSDLPKAKKSAMPKHASPQLATLTKSIPDGDQWLHETKFDGYRIISRIQKNKVQLLTRNGKDWTRKFKVVVDALEQMDYGDMIADGELCVLLPNGAAIFNRSRMR
jgi:bifunctional non-homologous end joining protein LigD